ncbi:MAG: hypothetical protein KF773_41405 [Deltaproteobacteria bacterium]|nr:hypothetical protein [Deltaproteobacteria bacterium]
MTDEDRRRERIRRVELELAQLDRSLERSRQRIRALEAELVQTRSEEAELRVSLALTRRELEDLQRA